MVSLWIVVYSVPGNEAPVYIGPFVRLDNAERFAEKMGGYVALIDLPEDQL